MDPYNSYSSLDPAGRPATPSASTPRKLDLIARLDVSDKWKDRFRAIERAGGPDLPKFRTLSPAERRGVQFNWIAFLFGPFYFLAKGLWRQAVVYVLLAIACGLTMEAVGLGEFGRAVGFGFAAVYAIRANVSYYRKVVLSESLWV